jgi:hypothetical protein
MDTSRAAKYDAGIKMNFDQNPLWSRHRMTLSTCFRGGPGGNQGYPVTEIIYQAQQIATTISSEIELLRGGLIDRGTSLGDVELLP